MKDDNKTMNQPVHELTELRLQNAELEKSTPGIKSVEPGVEEARRYAEDIVKTVREPILVLDADLNIITANNGFYSTFEVTPGETIGRFIYDLGDKQWDIPRLRELLVEVLPERGAFDNFEVVHNFRNIGHKIMLINARQIYRKEIGTNIIILAIEDITERRRLEDLLKESEQRFRRLFETASDGIVLLEKCEGKITHANQATEKILGYSNKELIGNRLQDIGVLIEMGDFQTTMRNLNESGILNYNDVSVKTKAGQYVCTDIYLVDKAKLVQCNIRDITKRKLADYALSESEKHYRMLFDSIDEGFCIIEIIFGENKKAIDYRFLETNPAFEKQTGLIDARGKRMRELAPKLEEHWFEIYGKIAVTGQPARFVNRAEELHRWYDVYAFRFGKPENREVAVLFKDITERRKMEDEIRHLNAELEQRVIDRTVKLELANEELEAFTYSASHDLKAPLRVIDGYARILIEDHAVHLDDEGRRSCEVIINNARKMCQLIDALLAFSRMGRIEMNPEPINMATIANEVILELTTSEDRERIDFSVGLLPPAVGDPTLLRQVWTNLLGNAIKFSAQRERAVIEVGCLFGGGGHPSAGGREGHLSKGTLPIPIPESARVYFVRDNGAGFDMGYVGKLFGVFQRLHSEKEFEGTGAGLAIVQRIVQRHGGRIWAEGEVDKGASFYFSIG